MQKHLEPVTQGLGEPMSKRHAGAEMGPSVLVAKCKCAVAVEFAFNQFAYVFYSES